MNKKDSADDFLYNYIGWLFDPTGSENLEFVSKKIVDGLIENELMKKENFEDERDIAA